MTIDGKFMKNICLPVGSLRHSEDKNPRDLDLIVTKQLHKEQLQDIKQVEDISGGEKRIDFKWNYVGADSQKTYINVNLFIFLSPRTWGAALLHSTGNYGYNIILRKKAKNFGWKLSQNGLVINDKIIITKTERSLLKKLEVNERRPIERDIKI